MSDESTAQTTGEQSAPSRPFRRKLLRAIIWIAASLPIYLLLSFFSGLINNHLDISLSITALIFGVPAMFIILALRLRDRWRNLDSKHKIINLLLVPLLPLLAFGLLYFSVPRLAYQSFRLFSLGLQIRTERIVELDKLQDWATEFLQQPPWDGSSDKIDRSPLYHRGDKEIPDFVWKLDPNFVSVVSRPDIKCVGLVYGGGFLHWSITIYPRGSSFPQTPDKWRIPWRKGIEFYQS